jgi:anti-anti-sigma regulatory factor
VSQNLEYFHIERQNDVTIVTPIFSDFLGEVINFESKKELVHFADSVRPEKVVVDFRNIHCFSTDFVGTLLSFKKRIPPGGAVKLCSLQPVHREIFQIFHLDGTVFSILETVQEAVRSFA